MTPAIPVSVVDFVNAWPVTWGFLKGAVEGFLPINDVPSVCAERLARGEVQAGVIPAVEAGPVPGGGGGPGGGAAPEPPGRGGPPRGPGPPRPPPSSSAPRRPSP